MSCWIVVFYIVTATGVIEHGACFELSGTTPDTYVSNLNKNYWYGKQRAVAGQAAYAWLPCDPAIGVHFDERDDVE